MCTQVSNVFRRRSKCLPAVWLPSHSPPSTTTARRGHARLRNNYDDASEPSWLWPLELKLANSGQRYLKGIYWPCTKPTTNCSALHILGLRPPSPPSKNGGLREQQNLYEPFLNDRESHWTKVPHLSCTTDRRVSPHSTNTLPFSPQVHLGQTNDSQKPFGGNAVPSLSSPATRRDSIGFFFFFWMENRKRPISEPH